MAATHCDNDQETSYLSEKGFGKSKEKGAHSIHAETKQNKTKKLIKKFRPYFMRGRRN